MSKNKKYKNKPEDFKGIHFSYRDDDWILRINESEYRLYPVIQKDEDSKYAGKFALGRHPKHFTELKNIFEVMRRQGITHIMNKKNRQTMKELLKEIREFNDWAENKLNELTKELV